MSQLDRVIRQFFTLSAGFVVFAEILKDEKLGVAVLDDGMIESRRGIERSLQLSNAKNLIVEVKS
ncbi:MAG: hypothetical protein V7K27_16585 [Nostoc sp.]|uniref:hypothetical protein n=1 Tax=Nostoc sp. TaxID=1180 RepID=UPI002FFC7B0C